MKYAQRKEKVLAMLQKNETLSIQKLVDILGSSEATVRRDVIRMEESGLLERCWGGVKRLNTPENTRKSNLQTAFPTLKHEIIGQTAAAQLKENELIFIGSGTTTLAMIPFIQNRKIQVITNGIPQLEALYQKGIKALLLSGFFKEYSHSLVGKETVEMLRRYRFDQAFLGANGVDANYNLLSGDDYEDRIKTACIRQSRSVYLLVSGEKFHRTAMYAISPETAANVTIITDEPPDANAAWKKRDKAFMAKMSDLNKN